MKFIRAVLVPREGFKTKLFRIETVDGMSRLGFVKWFGRWRCYAFFPEPGTLYEAVCLADLSAFLKEENAEHRAAVKARKSVEE